MSGSDLPDYRSGNRFYVLTSENPPFPYTGTNFLSPNGQQLVADFSEFMGECLGGGVFKSKDLDNYARSRPASVDIHTVMKAKLARLPARQAMAMASELQSEWIAFEFALVLTQPMFGLSLPMAWDNVLSLRSSKKTFSKDIVTTISYSQPNGERRSLAIQANAQGMGTLFAIASATGVPTSLGK